jgi:hypothetical protein
VSLVPSVSEEGDAGRAPDDVPEPLVRAHRWVLDHWPTSLRRRIAVVVVIVAVAIVVVDALARLVGVAVGLGLLSYLSLMVVCWVGAGGALVPVPGTRPLSWVMIVQQSTVLLPPAVAVLAALAMAVGQTSFFVATRTEGHRHVKFGGLHLHRHEVAGADDPSGAASESAGAAGKRAPNRLVAWSRGLLARGEALVKERMTVHPQRIVFVLCVLPNPLTTFATVSAAATGVPFSRFFVASLGGFLVLTVALVVAGQAILAALGIS